MPMDNDDPFPQTLNGAWRSDKGHWAEVADQEDFGGTAQDFERAVGAAVLRLLRNPNAAMAAIRQDGTHIQISRDEPGAPLTLKEYD